MNLPDTPDGLLVTEEQFNSWFESSLEAVQSILKDHKSKSLIPILDVLYKEAEVIFNGDTNTTNRAVYAIADDFNEYEDKRRILEHIGHELYEKQWIPIAVSIASEVWMSHQDPNKKTHVHPRHDPKREEGVFVAAVSLGNQYRSGAMAHITRIRGKIVLDPFKHSEGEIQMPIMEHVFRGFFKEPAKRHHEQN